MSLLRRMSDEDAELLLAGHGPDRNGASDAGELGSFVRALAVAVPAQPRPELGARLVPRLAETARAAAAAETTAVVRAPRWRAPRSRFALAARAAVAVALVPAMMTGLAFAGVTLPEPARSVFDRVGIDLPNQAAVEDNSAAEEDTGGDGTSGGHGASDKGAQGESADKGKSNGDSGKAHGQSRGHANGHGASRGNSASAPGLEGTSPGLEGTTPGQGDLPPPGQGGTPPGQTFEPASPNGQGAPVAPPGQSKPKPKP